MPVLKCQTFFSLDHGQLELGLPEEDRHLGAGQQGLRALRLAGRTPKVVQLKIFKPKILFIFILQIYSVILMYYYSISILYYWLSK